MENDDESHDEANYASKPGHLWSSGVKESSGGRGFSKREFFTYRKSIPDSSLERPKVSRPNIKLGQTPLCISDHQLLALTCKTW
jgi:hypothetical protein